MIDNNGINQTDFQKEVNFVLSIDTHSCIFSSSIGPNPHSHIDPSISPSIGPNHDSRFHYQTYVPGLGLGSYSYPKFDFRV